MSSRWSMAQTCIRIGLPREVTLVLGPEAQRGQRRDLRGAGYSLDDSQSCSNTFWFSSLQPGLWAPLCPVSLSEEPIRVSLQTKTMGTWATSEP